MRFIQRTHWFATTPMVIQIKDGIVVSAKDRDAAETPDPSWWQ
jgi:hypothetical protein